MQNTVTPLDWEDNPFLSTHSEVRDSYVYKLEVVLLNLRIVNNYRLTNIVLEWKRKGRQKALLNEVQKALRNEFAKVVQGQWIKILSEAKKMLILQLDSIKINKN